MAENAAIQNPAPAPTPPLGNFKAWQFHAALAVMLAVVMVISTIVVYQEAVADAAEDTAEAIAEAEEAGEDVSAVEPVEVDFEIEEAYKYWAAGLIFLTIAEVIFYGVRRGWPFATTVQVGLIILLTLSFILITQRVERDVFQYGAFALIVFTLFQVVFGNISPEANFRQSMVGLLIGAVIISVVVGIAIWLVPYLIELG